MTTAQSTGSMVFSPIARHRQRHLLLLLGQSDARTGLGSDAGGREGAAPALRDAVTMFSGVLDDFCMNMLVATVKDCTGRTNVLGITVVAGAPFSFIAVHAAAEEVGGMSDILLAFDHIRTELGLTQKEMFTATGIKHRTYHSWKRKSPDSRPRVSSQGRFWRLVDTLEDLPDAVGRPVDQWIRGTRDGWMRFSMGALTTSSTWRSANRLMRNAPSVPRRGVASPPTSRCRVSGPGKSTSKMSRKMSELGPRRSPPGNGQPEVAAALDAWRQGHLIAADRGVWLAPAGVDDLGHR